MKRSALVLHLLEFFKYFINALSVMPNIRVEQLAVKELDRDTGFQ